MRPVLGEAAEHDEPGVAVAGQRLGLAGHGVHERLVDHDQAAGPEQRARCVVGRVQHAGRVGRVADHDQVGVVGDRAPGRARSGVRVSTHLGDLVPGLLERGVRLGELGVHDDRAPPGPQPRHAG